MAQKWDHPNESTLGKIIWIYVDGYLLFPCRNKSRKWNDRQNSLLGRWKNWSNTQHCTIEYHQMTFKRNKIFFFRGNTAGMGGMEDSIPPTYKLKSTKSPVEPPTSKYRYRPYKNRSHDFLIGKDHPTCTRYMSKSHHTIRIHTRRTPPTCAHVFRTFRAT